MKHLKALGLLAAVVGALMGVAGSASATTLTSPAGTTYFGGLHFESVGHVLVFPGPLPTVECTETFEGTVQVNGVKHGGTNTTPVSGPITHYTLTPCTNSWHLTSSSGGTFSIASSGTVGSNGWTFEATRFGIACRYATSNTVVGELTDSAETGATATLHMHGLVPFHSGSGLCGSGSATLKGSLKVTSPDQLILD